MPYGSLYGSWPPAPRAMAVAVDAAIRAAQVGDADGFDTARAALARVDGEQLAVLLGTVLRDLLERAAPDGLDSDDVGDMVRTCVASSSWFAGLEVDAVVRALTGTLGLDEGEEAAVLAGPIVVAHGLLLIASLLTTIDAAPPAVIEPALRELMRAQTVELP